MKSNHNPKRRSYYVPHPRYGTQPRLTGLDVRNLKDGVYFRCWTASELESWTRKNSYHGIDPAHIGCLIPGTAIVADPSQQVPSSIATTHYYDIERKCHDCGLMFIFYAEEQKYWYEKLKFPLNADCIRCAPCRKRSQTLDGIKARFDELITTKPLTISDEIEMTLARLDLVEAGIFHARQIEHIRAFLNNHPDHDQTDTIRTRLTAITTKS